ncbi:macrophage migration inhibitory factor-like [Bufo gargarizans]|uniref:macrophage migration inhibitory factor-like n=1 Tax=Bufo gargarizans TaxID=30331 RepID=UPI001CF1D380|nr:macrophage migration inhibitory factor-like [Bufo gargarizans]XP_044145621.1 macrophage migration inhibitory factor-like [Bufo gargarizans]
MPTFELFTNVARDAIPENLLCSLTEQLAKATGKPSEYIAVHIMPDQMMSFGGTTEPCALCSLKSIGKIGGPQNKNYTTLLSDILSKQLHISANRVYFNFVDLNPSNVGWNKTTFA